MSLENITTELKRFLGDDTPSVVCIRGRWGVGKTFIWNKILISSYEDMTLASEKYSYVSLFGINSILDLRSSIVENTISPDKLIEDIWLDKFHTILRESFVSVIKFIASIFRRENVFDAAASASFLLVRNQLICIDDLERAGRGLDQKDVLGIASFLKERRKCKVVILYNDHEINENKVDFDKQLEKVADKIIEFSLSPDEAARVAIQGNGKTEDLIRLRIKDLNLTNIRIIKRIDSYKCEFTKIFESLDSGVVEQIVSAIVLGSWSLYQPGISAPISYIRSYNRFSLSLGDDKNSEENKKWSKMLDDYPYNNTDQLDNAIYDGIVCGFFDIDRINILALDRQKEIEISGRKNSFDIAWEELFHGSLSIDDDDFLDALYISANDNIRFISPMNINSTIKMLREFGRPESADKLAAEYVKSNAYRGFGFFDIASDPFVNEKEMDVVLKDEFYRYLSSYVDDRIPLDVFQSMAERQSWDEQDLLMLSKQSSQEFEEMFLAIRGANLRRAIQLVLMISRQRQPEAEAIKLAAGEALRRIAARSPIRALRLRRYGIDPVSGLATD